MEIKNNRKLLGFFYFPIFCYFLPLYKADLEKYTFKQLPSLPSKRLYFSMINELITGKSKYHITLQLKYPSI